MLNCSLYALQCLDGDGRCLNFCCIGENITLNMVKKKIQKQQRGQSLHTGTFKCKGRLVLQSRFAAALNSDTGCLLNNGTKNVSKANLHLTVPSKYYKVI